LSLKFGLFDLSDDQNTRKRMWSQDCNYTHRGSVNL